MHDIKKKLDRMESLLDTLIETNKIMDAGLRRIANITTDPKAKEIAARVTAYCDGRAVEAMMEGRD